jgi:hypothetical protein
MTAPGVLATASNLYGSGCEPERKKPGLSLARRYDCCLLVDDVAASHVVEGFLNVLVVETVKRELLCAARAYKGSASHVEDVPSAEAGQAGLFSDSAWTFQRFRAAICLLRPGPAEPMTSAARLTDDPTCRGPVTRGGPQWPSVRLGLPGVS